MIRKAILILCTLGAIGTAVAWVMSYSQPPPDRSVRSPRMEWGGGRLVLRSWARLAAEGILIAKDDEAIVISGARHRRSWGLFGVRLTTRQFYPSGIPLATRHARHAYELHLPFWFLTTALAAYPVVDFVGGWRRKRHRLRHNLCLGCGYPLKGLPSPRCPECSTPFDPNDLRKDCASLVTGDGK